MTDISEGTVLENITRHYLESHDFNGSSIQGLCNSMGTDWGNLRVIVTKLINQELVGAIFSDAEINIHINRMGFEPVENQIEKISADNISACLYPLTKHLEKVVDRGNYSGRPYVLALALGEAQLSYRSFDLSVLGYYRDDPRYRYDNNDISGIICIEDEYFESDLIPERDQILLETFGISYDEEFNRAIAVFIRYLADLSPEHQQIWSAKELPGDYELHPDYFRNSILGEWGEGVSVFDAFLKELWIINQMCEAMQRPNLFRSDYGEYGEDKPREFGFLIRPTLAEFNSFVHLLDKLISDNINTRFFMNEIQSEVETLRKDGKVIVQNKGSLKMLDEWIREFFRTDDWEPWNQAIKHFRKVRKLRQKPAHSVNENVFNQMYFKEQREIIIDAYGGVRTLRLMLQNHPLVQQAEISIPDWLHEGQIWTY